MEGSSDMTFDLKNLGLIKHANIGINNLTVICGKNNTGKTYLTHSLYGVLSYLRESNRYHLKREQRESLKNSGYCEIDLYEYAVPYWTKFNDRENGVLKNSIPGYLGKKVETDLPEATISISEQTVAQIRAKILDFRFDFPVKMHEGYTLDFKKKRDSSILSCRYVPVSQINQNIYEGLNLEIPQSVVSNVSWVVYYLMMQKLPRPFIIGSERTGISVFRDEFSIYRTIAFEDNVLSDRVKELKEKFVFSSYPIAIRKDIDFSLQLSTVAGRREPEFYANSGIKDAFENIVEGEYDVNKETGKLYYIPKNGKKPLTLNESSSSVRALCELYFYLRYIARPNDVLMIDEPEMNLHPEAQRRLARLLVRLANKKIKVFISTHSEYILREINALVRMNELKERELLLQKYRYVEHELISKDDVNCYVLKDGVTDKMKAEGNYGFSVSSFDDTISAINALYDDIADNEFGGE